MPTFLLASASALLLAAIVTEIFTRFLPTDYWTLLVTVGLALFVNGIFNARVAQGRREKVKTPSAKSGSDDRPDNRRNEPNRRSRDNTRKRGRQNDQRNAANNATNNDRNRGGNKAGRGEPAAAPDTPSGPREEGTVKWFNRSKGYGFVVRSNGDEIFVHQRAIVSSGDQRQRPVLRDGQKVSFVVSKHEKGVQAEQVQAVD